MNAAIVTDIAGTTRDTIEEKVKVGSITLRLSDTAGIRYTDDTVEKLGVDRAITAAEEARLVIAVIDSTKPLSDEDREIIARAENAEKAIIVLNKCDMPKALSEEDIGTKLPICRISAKSGDGIDELCAAIDEMFKDDGAAPVGEIITNARQADAIARAVKAVTSALDAMKSGLTPDCVLVGVEEAMTALGELSGKTIREDITDRIFERFCVGK